MNDAAYYELIGRFVYGYQRAAGGLERLAPLIDGNDADAVAELDRLRETFALLTERQQQLVTNGMEEGVDTDSLVEWNADLAEYAHAVAQLCGDLSASR